MRFDAWYQSEFRETLGETLSEMDAMPDSTIDGMLQGKPILESMRAYYRVAGRHWLNTNHNMLRMPGDWESAGDFRIFMDENQNVVQWAIRNADLSTEDPIVYQGQQTDAGYEWYAEGYTFSRFIIAMWKWILTGEEPDC